MKILFHHGDFPRSMETHDYFGSGGSLHQNLEKLAEQKIEWYFVGGFIDENHTIFWNLVADCQVLFIRAQNMNHENIQMHWHHAEESMLRILDIIKALYPELTIFFYEYFPENLEKFQKYGEAITDLHGDEDLLDYFENI